MATTCPKCSYKRKPSDSSVPNWRCPDCGIAYAKYGVPAPLATSAPDASIERDLQFSWISMKTMVFTLVGLTALGYLAYDKYMKPKNSGESAQTYRGAPVLEVASHPAFFGTVQAGALVLHLKPETAAGLAQLSGPAKVVMFGTSWCPYCAEARQVFDRNGVRFVELDVERDAEAKRFLEKVMGMHGFPIIIIGNRLTNGFDEGQILASLKEL